MAIDACESGLYLLTIVLLLGLSLWHIQNYPVKGQVIIPAQVRAFHHWEVGQELLVIDVGDGILLKPKSPFPETLINDVVGCLRYQGNAKTLEEMDDAIKTGI